MVYEELLNLLAKTQSTNDKTFRAAGTVLKATTKTGLLDCSRDCSVTLGDSRYSDNKSIGKNASLLFE